MKEEEERKIHEYQVKAYIWVSAESEDQAEEKLKEAVTVLDIVEVEEI